MPKSKKPRKGYHKRERRIPYLRRSTLDEIRAKPNRKGGFVGLDEFDMDCGWLTDSVIAWAELPEPYKPD